MPFSPFRSLSCVRVALELRQTCVKPCVKFALFNGIYTLQSLAFPHFSNFKNEKNFNSLLTPNDYRTQLPSLIKRASLITVAS